MSDLFYIVRFILVAQYDYISFIFIFVITFHFINIPQFIYPFIADDPWGCLGFGTIKKCCRVAAFQPRQSIRIA